VISFIFGVVRGHIQIINLSFKNPLGLVFLLLGIYLALGIIFGLSAHFEYLDWETISFFFEVPLCLNVLMMYVLVCTFLNDEIAFKKSALVFLFTIFAVALIYCTIGLWHWETIQTVGSNFIEKIVSYPFSFLADGKKILINSDGRPSLFNYNQANLGVLFVFSAIALMNLIVEKKNNPATLVITIFLLMSCLFALSLSGTRTALISFLIIVFVTLLWASFARFKNLTRIFVILPSVSIVAIIFSLVNLPMYNRILTSIMMFVPKNSKIGLSIKGQIKRPDDEVIWIGGGGRVEIWQDRLQSVNSWLDPKGFFGAVLSRQTGRLRLEEGGMPSIYPKSSHNLIIDTIIWSGIPGLFIISALFAIFIVGIYRHTQKTQKFNVLMLGILLFLHSMLLPITSEKFFWLELSILIYLTFRSTNAGITNTSYSKF
jgi:hypothetical protein